MRKTGGGEQVGMSDREKTMKRLEECLSASCRGFRTCPYSDTEWDAVRAAYELLKEQDEERKRLISWMGKFCAHVDQQFQPMQDAENTRFFREKMRTQFGWEVSGDD